MKDSKLYGRARTITQASATSGEEVEAAFDKVGRQITYPYQVRGLMATAYATATTQAETAILAGVSGVYHDLVLITGANSSNAAVTIDVRDGLAGGVVTHFDIPANSIEALPLNVPYPQNEAGNAWTFKNTTGADLSNTTVSVSALFVKNT